MDKRPHIGYFMGIEVKGSSFKKRKKKMVSTTRITSNVKISEFPEMADALFDAINNNSERRWGILELLNKQTEAKQNKFWKFYDAFVASKVGA
jgi:hypothetical protein